MQTFAPYPSCRRSATVLDGSRLWKQVLEADQILGLLRGQYPQSPWRHHPAFKMWFGHSGFLILYRNSMLKEFLKRGGNTERPLLREETHDPPLWWGDPVFHQRHQARLLDKDPEHYGPLFPFVSPVGFEEGYLWPELDRSHPEGYYLRLKNGARARV